MGGKLEEDRLCFKWRNYKWVICYPRIGTQHLNVEKIYHRGFDHFSYPNEASIVYLFYIETLGKFWVMMNNNKSGSIDFVCHCLPTALLFESTSSGPPEIRGQEWSASFFFSRPSCAVRVRQARHGEGLDSGHYHTCHSSLFTAPLALFRLNLVSQRSVSQLSPVVSSEMQTGRRTSESITAPFFLGVVVEAEMTGRGVPGSRAFDFLWVTIGRQKSNQLRTL